MNSEGKVPQSQLDITFPVVSVNGSTGAVTLTKADLTLDNVDNTSDINKPVSTATQTALNLKATTSSLAIVATSGSYVDLFNKPTIPGAQVNSDWAATTGLAQILNKPTLSTVATTGSYNDLFSKPTIPTLVSQLINDSGFITSNLVTSVAGRIGAISLTKSDVGLSNVDNTSDLNKPVSNATQTALNLKQDSNSAVTLTGNQTLTNKTLTTPVINSPTGITKSDVGLSNVVNLDTSNPVSIAQSANYRFVSDTEKSIWSSKQSALGYVPEDVTNKSATTTLGTSNTLYPTQGAVKSYVDTIAVTKVNISSLATVATSGSYLDLSNRPTIPTNTNQLTNGSGYLVNSNNLSDLSNVTTARTNLGLGTLATQSGTFSGTSSGTNTGDETTATIQTKLGVASTSASGYLTSTDWNTFNGKQAALVSGTNLKTINSTSLLGSGNISTVTPPAGTNGQIQFNSSGVFGSSSNLFYDATNVLTSVNKLQIQDSIVTPWNIYVTTDTQNPATTALYIAPNIASSQRIFLGAPSRNIYSLNLQYCNYIENAPPYSSGNLTFGGNPGPSHAILRSGTDVRYYATGSSANHIFYASNTYSLFTEVARINTSGFLGLNTNNPVAQLHAVSLNATTPTIIVQGATSQSSNLTEWRNSSGTVLARVLSTGDILSSGKVCFSSFNNSISRNGADGGTQIMCASPYFKFVDASNNLLFGLQTDQILRINNKTSIDGRGAVYRSHISESHYSNGESYRPSTDQTAFANFSFYGADVFTNNKGSALTINNRASVYIDSFPSTNINNVYPLLGNKWSLWIADGDQYIHGGNLKIGGSANSASRLDIEANSTTDVTVVIKAIASQTAPLLEVRNSSGVSKTGITKDFELQTSAGSGAPGTTPADGAMYVDTTNHRLYVRSDGTWKYTTLI